MRTKEQKERALCCIYFTIPSISLCLSVKLLTVSSREGTLPPPVDKAHIKLRSSANLAWCAYVSPFRKINNYEQRSSSCQMRFAEKHVLLSRPSICLFFASFSHSGSPQGAITERLPIYQLSATKSLLQQMLFCLLLVNGM